MLRELKVENLALIESLQLSFDEHEEAGLIVMTGETGAGKSIMLRAIHLLTGGRASVEWIRNEAESCLVEALFEIHPHHTHLLQQLESGGYGGEPSVIIKRIITRNGRSRLYVNGSLATVKTVSQLTGNMINIASQHDHQQLLQPTLHLDILDTLGEHWQLRGEVASLYGLWQKKSDELELLQNQEQDKEKRRDFLLYQLQEIQEAAVVLGEDEELSNEKKRLKSAAALISLSQESYSLLTNTINEGLNQVRRNMEQVVSLDKEAEKMAEEIADYAYRAEDVSVLLRSYRDSLTTDPLRLDQVNERLDLLQALKRKYGQSLESVLAYGHEAEEELQGLENIDLQLQGLITEIAHLEKKIMQLAGLLSQKRKDTALYFSNAVSSELKSLAFSDASFEVHWQEVDQNLGNLQASGWDRVEFYFSANPGEPTKPLAKVASGGELSRLMLALKCILAKKDMVETVVFDEVDAGIGGEAAEAVARKIQELATHHQVFCITHLPQIASRGADHLLVSKNISNGRTLSFVSRLNEEERVDELARMLAGTSVSQQTQAWAKEMLDKGGLRA